MSGKNMSGKKPGLRKLKEAAMKFNHERFAILGIGLLALPLMMQAGTATAQYRIAPRAPAGSANASTEAPATTRNPQQVRTLLMFVHGFTRERLEAASTDVASILRGFIGDRDESMLVRRQAIKALRLFPTDGNFAFIRGNVADAPEGLQRLYLHSLRGFAGTRDEQIGAILEPLLDSNAVGVRHAAAGLSRKLVLSASLRARINSRLAREQDPGVRSALRKALRR